MFSLTIFQDYLYTAKLIRVGVSLPETVGGSCRFLNNFFTAGYVLSGQTRVLPRIASTCGPSQNI